MASLSFWGAWRGGRQPRVTGRQTLVVAFLALLLTAVLPPLAAHALNATRVRTTEARAIVAATLLRPRLSDLVGATSEYVVVACGPGRMPDAGPTGQWVSRAVQAPRLFGVDMPTDAWGRCFLLNVESIGEGVPVWLMSAGPDGVISTPPSAGVLSDDDIGVRLQ